MARAFDDDPSCGDRYHRHRLVVDQETMGEWQEMRMGTGLDG